MHISRGGSDMVQGGLGLVAISPGRSVWSVGARPGRALLIVAGVASVVGPSAAMAHDVNMWVYARQGALRTGTVEGPPSLTRVPNVDAFDIELGEDVPNAGFQPSIRVLGGADALPAGSGLGFTIEGRLREWTGVGFGRYSDLSLSLSKGPLKATTPDEDVPVTGFSLPIASDGSMYEHLEMVLNASEPTAGIWLLQLSFWSTAPGLRGSGTKWLVVSQDVPMSQLATAYAYAVENVPTPGAACLGMVAMGMVARRRRPVAAG